jgi:hypothetical protein
MQDIAADTQQGSPFQENNLNRVGEQLNEHANLPSFGAVLGIICVCVELMPGKHPSQVTQREAKSRRRRINEKESWPLLTNDHREDIAKGQSLTS